MNNLFKLFFIKLCIVTVVLQLFLPLVVPFQAINYDLQESLITSIQLLL